MDITAEQIAIRAAAYVRAGWTQKKLMDLEGRVCGVGAAYRAAGLFHRTHEAARVVDGPLGQALEAFQDYIEADHDYWTIELWNDEPGRTAEEVADAWEATAITLRQKVPECALSA